MFLLLFHTRFSLIYSDFPDRVFKAVHYTTARAKPKGSLFLLYKQADTAFWLFVEQYTRTCTCLETSNKATLVSYPWQRLGNEICADRSDL